MWCSPIAIKTLFFPLLGWRSFFPCGKQNLASKRPGFCPNNISKRSEARGIHIVSKIFPFSKKSEHKSKVYFFIYSRARVQNILLEWGGSPFHPSINGHLHVSGQYGWHRTACKVYAQIIQITFHPSSASHLDSIPFKSGIWVSLSPSKTWFPPLRFLAVRKIFLLKTWGCDRVCVGGWAIWQQGCAGTAIARDIGRKFWSRYLRSCVHTHTTMYAHILPSNPQKYLFTCPSVVAAHNETHNLITILNRISLYGVLQTCIWGLYVSSSCLLILY